MNKLSITSLGALILLALVGVSLAQKSAHAGPVSGSSVKSNATVYDGVISVAPGGASADIMELGSLGTDIASSGDLYLRPDRLGESAGVRLTKNGSGTVDLHALGGVCLSAQCFDVWPVAGGTSLWNLQSNQYVEPATLSQGLSFTKTRNAGGAAMEVFSNNTTAAMFVNNTNAGANATAMTVNGDAFLRGNLNVTAPVGSEVMLKQSFCQGGPYDGQQCSQQSNCTGAFQCVPYSFCQGGPNSGQVCTAQAQCTGAFACTQSDYKVWYPGNDGKGSGLDASMLDGIDLDFQYNYNHFGCNVGSLHCLCAQISGPNGFPLTRCLQLQ